MNDKQTHDYFDKFTPHYDPERFEFALQHLSRSATPNQTLLDVGCGDGATLYAIKERTPLEKLTGLDISQSYLARAAASVGCQTIRGSILDRELVDRYKESFDFCTLGAVVHHLIGRNRRESFQYAAQCLENSLKLLRCGGELIIFEPAHGPSWLMSIAFWIKKCLGRVSSQRIEIFTGWLNFGQPVVSYYTPEQLRSFIDCLEGASIISSQQLAKRKLGGVICRTDMGIILKKAL